MANVIAILGALKGLADWGHTYVRDMKLKEERDRLDAQHAEQQARLEKEYMLRRKEEENSTARLRMAEEEQKQLNIQRMRQQAQWEKDYELRRKEAENSALRLQMAKEQHSANMILTDINTTNAILNQKVLEESINEKELWKRNGSDALIGITTELAAIREDDPVKQQVLLQRIVADAAKRYGLSFDKLQSVVEPLAEAMAKRRDRKYSHTIQDIAPDGHTMHIAFDTKGSVMGTYKTSRLAEEVMNAKERWDDQERKLRQDALAKITAAGNFYSKSMGGMISLGELSTEDQEERIKRIKSLVSEISEMVTQMAGGDSYKRAMKYFSNVITDEKERDKFVRENIALPPTVTKADIRGVWEKRIHNLFYDEKGNVYIPDEDWVVETREKLSQLDNDEERAVAEDIFEAYLKKVGYKPTQVEAPVPEAMSPMVVIPEKSALRKVMPLFEKLDTVLGLGPVDTSIANRVVPIMSNDDYNNLLTTKMEELLGGVNTR